MALSFTCRWTSALLCHCSSSMTKGHFLLIFYGTNWLLCVDVPLNNHSLIYPSADHVTCNTSRVIRHMLYKPNIWRTNKEHTRINMEHAEFFQELENFQILGVSCQGLRDVLDSGRGPKAMSTINKSPVTKQTSQQHNHITWCFSRFLSSIR